MRAWDTSTLAPRQQFGYWREVLCEAFTALDPVPEATHDFGSTVVLHELAGTNAAELHSFAQNVRRGWPEIRRCADEYYFANLQLGGLCIAEQDGRRVEAGPGSFYLVDTTRPYQLRFTGDFHTLSFRIPQQALATQLRQPGRATAVRVDAGSALGSLAVERMRELVHVAPQLNPEAATQQAAALATLIACSVDDAMPSHEEARRQLRQIFRDSLVRYVEARALDAGLSVDAVAQRFRVSPRYVHGVFAEREASFAQRVLELRLAAAARSLRAGKESITAIALGCGFADPSYFGRAFRQRYGCTPRDWRQRR